MQQTRKPADQFGTSVVRPPDFDDFWAAIMAEANAIPLNPTMEHVPMRSTDEVDVYEIGYDSLDGLRIAGWYCRPKESYLAPPYPALLIVPGYVSEPTLPKSWAKMGYAAVGVAPRGKLRSNRHYNPGYPGLLVNNIVDRHTYSYRGFYVDACRAVDFVLTRPEVDPKRDRRARQQPGRRADDHHLGACGATSSPAARPALRISAASWTRRR